MERFHLTYANALLAARLAYEEGRLAAQNGGECAYEQTLGGKTCVCAIGAALPAPVIERIKEFGYNENNLNDIRHFFTFEDEDDFDRLCELQLGHDSWAGLAASTANPAEVSVAHQKFEAIIHG